MIYIDLIKITTYTKIDMSFYFTNDKEENTDGLTKIKSSDYFRMGKGVVPKVPKFAHG